MNSETYKKIKKLYESDNKRVALMHFEHKFDRKTNPICIKYSSSLPDMEIRGDLMIVLSEYIKEFSEWNENIFNIGLKRQLSNSFDDRRGIFYKTRRIKDTEGDKKKVRAMFRFDDARAKSQIPQKYTDQENDYTEKQLTDYLLEAYEEKWAEIYLLHFLYGESLSELAYHNRCSKQFIHKKLKQMRQEVEMRFR